MRTFAFVFARGGSKGVPRKNIRMLGKVPLLGHSITLAKELPAVEKVFVSTDSPDIMKVAEEFGASVIHRPEEISQDSSPEWAAWQHAINWVQERYGEFDVFLSLPATSPLRDLSDIKRSLNAFTANTDVVVTITEARRSPWFNMVKLESDGSCSLLAAGKKRITRRQDVPKAYDLATVAYVSSPEFILSSSGIWDGRVTGVEVPQDRAIDIDTETDFQIAEYFWGIRS